MDTKKEYIAPKLTVVSFKMEQGYAASSLRLFQDQTRFEMDLNDPYYSDQSRQEIWTESSNYFGNDWGY